MTGRHLLYLLAVVLLLANCKASEGDEGADQHEEAVVLCVENCLKPLCSGNILVDPEYESVCESRCEARVTESEDVDCIDEYQNLLTCLEEASCDDYYLWYEQSEGAPCRELEAEVAGSCPSVELRD